MRLIPWWRVLAVVLLSTSFVISVSRGHTIEAVVIGVILVPSLALLGGWIYHYSRHGHAP